LPNLRSRIESAETPMALWIDLWFEFKKSFAAADSDGVRRTMAYARYCLASPSGDVRTAVACAFIEHLPTDPRIKAVLPELLTAEEFNRLEPILRYHVGEGVIAEIERDYRSRDRRNSCQNSDARATRRERR
jgi:hypothetical protein